MISFMEILTKGFNIFISVIFNVGNDYLNCCNTFSSCIAILNL